MECPGCGREFADAARGDCPFCGTSLDADRASAGADRSAAPSSALDPASIEAVPVKSGLLRGVGAFVAAFVLVGVAAAVDVSLSLGSMTDAEAEAATRALLGGIGLEGGFAGGALVALPKLVGFLLFNAHQVPIVGGGSSANVLVRASTAPGAPLTPAMYWLIPPLVLLYAGAGAARTAAVTDGPHGLVPGASVVLGYVPVAGVAAWLGAIRVGETVVGVGGVTGTVGPPLAAALGWALFYALVFGAIGGFLGGWAGGSDDREWARAEGG